MTKQEYLEYNKACEAEIRKMISLLLDLKSKFSSGKVPREIVLSITRHGTDLESIAKMGREVSRITEAKYAEISVRLVKHLTDVMEKCRAAQEYALWCFGD